jgi:hypothetical protein
VAGSRNPIAKAVTRLHVRIVRSGKIYSRKGRRPCDGN